MIPTKEFWKNSHFENMTADWGVKTDFLKQKLLFGYVMVPKNDQISYW